MCMDGLPIINGQHFCRTYNYYYDVTIHTYVATYICICYVLPLCFKLHEYCTKF